MSTASIGTVTPDDRPLEIREAERLARLRVFFAGHEDIPDPVYGSGAEAVFGRIAGSNQ